MKRLTSFTMAEVLITLGIIGIVAAMTLPGIMKHHRKVVIETALKKFYTTMNQAVLRSIADNEATKYWGFPTVDTPENIEDFYVRYFKKYLNTVETKIVQYGTDKSFTIYFEDGSGAKITYLGKDWYYCINAKYLKEYTKYKGSKCFLFGFYPTMDSRQHLNDTYTNKGIEPYVGAMKTDENGNYVPTTMDDAYSSGWYSKIIQMNNWTIPDDYPVKY